MIGGRANSATTVYPLENAAENPLVEYAARIGGLFAAQRAMRERGEELFAIYHSHPRQAAPAPSETDVRLAFYPEVVYFIVGFDENQPVLRAFRIYENERRWEIAEFEIAAAQ